MPLSLLMCASATRPVYNPAVYTFYCTVTVYARTSGALTHHSLSRARAPPPGLRAARCRAARGRARGPGAPRMIIDLPHRPYTVEEIYPARPKMSRGSGGASAHLSSLCGVQCAHPAPLTADTQRDP